MTTPFSSNKPLLSALHGQSQWPRPAWFMRQAGRYLPEYRALRAEAGGFLDLCDNPDFATEVTLQPIRRYDFDGSILFSDILTIPRALGQDLAFAAGEGPVLGALPELQIMADRLASGEAFSVLSPAYTAVSQIRAALPNTTTLIGFAGAPWTLATYMIEGGSSKAYAATKAMAYGDPPRFKALIDLLVRSVAQHLVAQIKAGADAVMVFDSWAGCLDRDAQLAWSADPLERIVRLVRDEAADTPIIVFPRKAMFAARALAGIDPLVSLQVDYANDLHAAARLDFAAVQGNLDPGRLLCGRDEVVQATRDVLSVVGHQRSHVFNLGHGIFKESDPDAVHWVLDAVRADG